MRRVRRARREIHEEGLVGRERLLELHPGDRLVGHVGHEVVARVVGRLDAGQAVVETGIPLVGLTAHEAVELVEARAAGPSVGRPGGADLPRRRLVVLAEEARAESVEPQHLRERRDTVGPGPGVTWERGSDLGDAPHVVHVVIAPREQGRPRWRTERGCVELVVAQAPAGQVVRCRHTHRPAKGARHAEAHVVDEHDEHVRRSRGSLDLEARRRGGVAGVEHRAARVVRLRNGEPCPVEAGCLRLGARDQ